MPIAPESFPASHPMALALSLPNDRDRAEPLEIDSLDGLAEKWESCLAIRQRARKFGSLLEWTSADAAGIPSMILLCIWGVGFISQGSYTIIFAHKK